MWKINLPFELEATVNVVKTDTGPYVSNCFDGRHVWFGSGTSIKAIEFWGPYTDLDNTTNNRWQEPALEDILKGGVGPKVRVAKTVNLSFKPRFIEYANDKLYVTDMPMTKIAVVNASTGAVIINVDVANGGNSAIKYANGRVYFVGACPTTQDLYDQQRLCWLDTTNNTIVQGALIPERKQTSCRYLEVANDILYVSSYNANGVIKFNSQTGAYLTTVGVNRQVSRLFRVDNDIFALSRASTVSVNSNDVLSTMISQVTQADAVNHLFGVLNMAEQIADDGTYLWACNTDGHLQRTKKADKATFLSKQENPVEPVEGEDPPPPITSDGVNPNVGADYAIDFRDVYGVLVTPSFKYTYTSEVTVRQYIFLFKEDKVVVHRLPYLFKWEYEHKINQYTAVSTGGLSYKAES